MVTKTAGMHRTIAVGFAVIPFPGLCLQQNDSCTNVLSSPYFQDVLNS